MNPPLHESLAQRIKRDVRLLDVAGEYAGEIRQHGKTRVCRCLCGQNSDRNPSFTLYEDHYHCFACGRHGSVIDLVMLVEQLDFKAALEFLRRHYLSGESRDAPVHRVAKPPAPCKLAISDDVKRVLDAATNHYHAALWRTPAVLDVLYRRGLTDDTLRRLRIGYAGGDLGQALFGQGVDLQLAARAGLISPRGEFLRGRIVIPVLDMQGRAVWMIGRALQDDDAPKYLGLLDGLVHKQPLVVGTPRKGVIWVEGPFDLAALVQWGLDERYLLIALLGTACDAAVQLLLPQLTPGAIICTDQDLAGKQAALKLATLLSTHGIASSVVADADRHERVSAWVTQAKQKEHLSNQTRVKLAQGQKELETVQALDNQHFIHWVRWGKAVKDPGDLCKLGERGQRHFCDALPG